MTKSSHGKAPGRRTARHQAANSRKEAGFDSPHLESCTRVMIDRTESLGDSLPLSLEREIIQVCSDFKSAWKAGDQPRIEDYVTRVPDNGRVAALRELVPVGEGGT